MNNEFVEKVFSHRGFKFLLFLGSYFLAIVLASLQMGGISVLTFFYGPVYFPLGFAWFFKDPKVNFENLLIISSSIYLAITLSAIAVKNVRVSKVLYVIFVILLILNIIGCAHTEIS